MNSPCLCGHVHVRDRCDECDCAMVRASCECGHENHVHDLWGGGPCTERGCECPCFRLDSAQ